MPTVKHVHQYHRRPNGIWHCSGIEGCTHFMPKNMGEPLGLPSKCWSCTNVFLLTPANMVNDKPMCDTCSEGLDSVKGWIEMRMKDVQEDSPLKRAREMFEEEKKRQTQEDEIEVISEHAPECDAWSGGECTCK